MAHEQRPPKTDAEFFQQRKEMEERLKQLEGKFMLWSKFLGAVLGLAGLFLVLYLGWFQNAAEQSANDLKEHIENDKTKSLQIDQKLNTVISGVSKLEGAVNTHILYLSRGVESNSTRITDLRKDLNEVAKQN